ncbi:MAG TPA: asparagine synthase (glutamine-hydrolyzing), partial [Acidimicrobiia bacterium]|nr:asparagine synthase (glutamine-hydrolyzing) [Acidimicrobiia bacterium]
AGSQPMRSPNGRYVAVFNGEMYGYQRQREQLDTFDRVRWQGHSDTEVLLAAIDRWGVRGALTRSNAMLALAVWDSSTRTLTLARDRLGEKPLYYGWTDGLLVFGSELKALRAVPSFDTAIDDEALALYLRHTFVPHPRTIFRSARQMPPGSLLEMRASDAVTACADPERWWDLAEIADEGASRRRPVPSDAVDELDELLRDSVAIRSVADVPLGAFLSGGIDSSIVVSLLHATGSPPRTFTVAMPEIGYDESAHARSVARYLGTNHTEIALSASDALTAVPELATLYDEPFADPSALPTHLVSSAARRHVTVCLSGDGGDEVFGGYNRQVAGPALWRWVSRLPRPVRALAAKAVLTPSPASWDRVARGAHRVLPHLAAIPNPGDKAQKLGGILAAERFDDLYTELTAAWPDPAELTGVDVSPEVGAAAVDGVEERMLYLDTAVTLPDDMLTKVDRASMGASLEVRVPLLDHRVVELAWRLPYAAKVHHGSGKRILRQVLDRYVPRHLVERPKMGFDPPIDTWLRGPLRDWAGDLLDRRALALAGIDPAPVHRRWAEHQASTRNHGYPLWTVLMYQSWRETL